MHKTFIKILAVIILITSFMPISNAFAEAYSKPEFRGRVIDAETKQPIEGAVVVVLYYKRTIIGINPGGPSAYAFKAQEILTDSKGAFYFPSFSSSILFTEDAGIKFIFFKPGYMSSSYPANVESELIEKYFSSDVVGKETTINNDLGRAVSYKGPLGIMELKKAKTYDERRMAVPSAPSNYTSNDLPLFFKAISEDRKERGLEVR
jgi:hypothetical protein